MPSYAEYAAANLGAWNSLKMDSLSKHVEQIYLCRNASHFASNEGMGMTQA